jgi:hypothetical protein
MVTDSWSNNQSYGGRVRVIVRIYAPAIIDRILKHLEGKKALSTIALLLPERGPSQRSRVRIAFP